MKKLTQIILIISIVYATLLLYFQYDYFLEFTPVIILLLAFNFYLIYKYNNKRKNYLFNSLLFIFLIICFAFGAILRQDWNL